MKSGRQKAFGFLKLNLEAIVWITVIVYFAISPVATGTHFTVCPLGLAGFQYCPGCGLGRSIILAFHGHLAESFKMNPFGIFAVSVLLARVITVFRNYIQLQHQISNL